MGSVLPASYSLTSPSGIVLMILLLLSVSSWAIILGRVIAFARMRVGRSDFVDPVIMEVSNGRLRAAEKMVAKVEAPLARLLRTALRGFMNPALADGELREDLDRLAASELGLLDRSLRALPLIASLSPLLGLLGTVLGLIEAFQVLEQSDGRMNPVDLAGGIWGALVTTAVGLGVAIPAAAAHHWLDGRIERLDAAMTETIARLQGAHAHAAAMGFAEAVGGANAPDSARAVAGRG